MTDRNRVIRPEKDAAQRLDAAVAERIRLGHEHDASRGTSGELEANASLQIADENVVARKRWLRWVGEPRTNESPGPRSPTTQAVQGENTGTLATRRRRPVVELVINRQKLMRRAGRVDLVIKRRKLMRRAGRKTNASAQS
jgi:hypothetical protein